MSDNSILGLPRKRRAAPVDLDSDSESDIEVIGSREVHASKRPKRIRNLGFGLIEITFEFNEKLQKVLPDVLNERLIGDYTKTIKTLMKSLDTGITNPPRFHYSIIVGSRVRGRNPDFDFGTVDSGIADLGQANKEVFKEFLLDRPAGLKQRNFVELETREGLSNPQFLRLHAVRAGDVGWGFDCDGCLSLFMTTEDNSNLKDKVFYVKRTQVQVENAGHGMGSSNLHYCTCFTDLTLAPGRNIFKEEESE